MNGFLRQGTYSSGTYFPFFSARDHIFGVDDAVALVVMVVVPPPALRGKGDDDHGDDIDAPSKSRSLHCPKAASGHCSEAAAEAETAVAEPRSAATAADLDPPAS